MVESDLAAGIPGSFGRQPLLRPMKSTQNVLSRSLRPLAAIRVTSPVPPENPLHARPYFLLHEPSRDQFIDETIAWLFGCQCDGSKHTWERIAVSVAIARPDQEAND